MNEEIGRILQLLESGKISADEAERLIRAVNEPVAVGAGTRVESSQDTFVESAAEICPNPFRDIEQLVKGVSRLYKTGLKRQRRFEEFRVHEHRRSKEEERRQRAESQSATDRIRYVLSEKVLVDPDSNLEELDEIGRGLLRFELETEFGIEIPKDDIETIGSVEALTTYVEGRTKPPAPKPPANPAPKPAAPKKPAARKPAAPRKRPAKSPPST